MWIMDVRIISYFFRIVNAIQRFEPLSEVPTDYSMCNVNTEFYEQKILSSIEM